MGPFRSGTRPATYDDLRALPERQSASQVPQFSPGMIRRMNSSNKGTVKAVSPWWGLQIMPLAINWFLVGPRAVTSRPNVPAMSPDRCGPGPSSAIARRYFFSAGVSRSNLTRKKLSSSAATAGFQKCLQVMLQITVVREARFGIKVQPDLDVGILDLQGLGEPGQCSKRPLSEVLGLLVPGEPQQGLAQLRGQNCWQ